MKSLLLSVVCCLAASHAWAASQKIAFDRGGSIYVAAADGTGAKKVAKGSDPAISPDGGSIAYTDSGATGSRRIAVLDLASGKSRVLAQIPGDNNYGPQWSPDGSTIAFWAWVHDDWQIGLVRADGGDFRLIKKPVPSFFPSAWSIDGGAIFCVDYAGEETGIVLLGTDGKVHKTWSLKGQVPDGTFSSATVLSVSPDGKSLLFDIDLDEKVSAPKGWDAPPSSVWKLDMASGKAERLSTKGIIEWSPCWLNEKEYLCLRAGKTASETLLVKKTLGDPKGDVILRDARSPSASR